MSDINPYQAPESFDDAGDRESGFAGFRAVAPEYASRWLRLGGAVLDNVIVMATFVPAYTLLFTDRGPTGWGIDNSTETSVLWVCLLALFGIGIVNLVLICLRGQTIGKLLCGTVVVTHDFQQASGADTSFAEFSRCGFSASFRWWAVSLG